MILEKFAKLVVDYCVGVKPIDEVLITSTYEAYPLVRELYREVIIRGGYPRFLVSDEIFQELFYRYASDELLAYVSRIDKYIIENIDVRISILSSTHTKPLVKIDPEKMRKRSMALREFTEIFMKRDADGSLRWVVTAYPTRAMAQEAGMSPLEFEEFVYRSLKLHEEDPIKAWVKQAQWQQKIADFLNKASEIHIIAENTDLYLRVDGRKWINDDGKKNMPGGEVFTGPVEDATEGYIEFTYPAVWRGVEVEGIKLVFKRGAVVEAKARRGEEFLKKMLEVDEGARRLGEAAFGLNYDVTRFTKEILFDEKIGGTIHLALGAAYPETGGKNKSAIHWDMVKDMKKGKVYVDGDLVYENGRFIEELL